MIRTIVKLYRDYKPLGFFGMCAAVLTVIAVLMFIPILIAYLETGLVLRFPTCLSADLSVWRLSSRCSPD